MQKFGFYKQKVEVENYMIQIPAKKTVMRVVAWIVPVGILTGTAINPPQPMIQQALVGFMLIWLYVLAIFGFENKEEE